MTTYAISMVRDEEDVIEGMVRHTLDEVDAMIVADNNSVDNTRKILDSLERAYGGRLIIVDDFEVAYQQSRKMSGLAESARQCGATWIVPVDADELWVAPDRISDILTALTDDVTVVPAKLYNHFASAADSPGDDPFRTIEWRQAAPAPLPKVAFRAVKGVVVEQGNHGVQLAGWSDCDVGMQIRHFPYRTAEQFVRKARNGAQAYRQTDFPPSVGAHWRSYGDILDRLGEQALVDVFREHFWYLSPIDSGLIPDPAPYMRWRR